MLAPVATLFTSPPSATSILDYDKLVPQRCLWAALGLLMGGAFSGFADIWMLATYTREYGVEVRRGARCAACSYHREQTAMATRARVWCGFIMLSYPFFAILMASIVFAVGELHFAMRCCGLKRLLHAGLTTVAWQSQDALMRTLSLLLLTQPLFVVVPLLVRSLPVPEKQSQDSVV